MLGFYTLLGLGVSQFANHLAINITVVRLQRSAIVTNLQAETAESLIDCLKGAPFKVPTSYQVFFVFVIVIALLAMFTF